MKSYGKLDFSSVKNFKIESGPAFPTKGVEIGFFFWLTTGIAGPYAWTGTKWKPFFELELESGRPAFIESVGGVLTSVDSLPYLYTLSGLLGASGYMNIAGSIGSNTVGYAMPAAALIRRITIQSSSILSGTAAFQLRKNPATTAMATYTIPAGSKIKTFDVSLPLNAGDELSMYVSAGGLGLNAIATLEIGWR